MSRGRPDGKAGLIGKSLYVGHYYVTVQKKLGEGGFADIYQVVDRNDHSAFYALKHFRICGDPEKLASVKRECLLMKSIKKHPNIVTLFAACFAGIPVATDGFFLMELCHQDLVKALTANHRHMTEVDILRIFQQVAMGLSYMHTQNPPVAHWDLKAENILQSLNGSWVVCDFGSATTMNEVVDPSRVAEVEDLVRRNTTAAYRAPEMYDLWSGNRINTQVDIFADDKLSVIRGRYTIPPSQHRPATRNLIAQMLCVDPAQRPDIHAVVASVKSLLEGGHAAPAATSAASSNPAMPQAIPQAGVPGPSMNHVPQTPPNAHVPHAHAPHAHASHPAHSPQRHHPHVVHPGLAHSAHHAQQHAAQPAQGSPYPGAAHYPPQMVAQQQQQAPALQHPGAVQLQMPSAAHNGAPNTGVGAPAGQVHPGVPHHPPGVPHTAHAVKQIDPFPQQPPAAAQQPPADPAAAYDPYAAPPPPPPPVPTDPFEQATPSGADPIVALHGAEVVQRIAPAAYPAVPPAVEQGVSVAAPAQASAASAASSARPSQEYTAQHTASPASKSPITSSVPSPAATGTNNQQQHPSPKSHPITKPGVSRPESPSRAVEAAPAHKESQAAHTQSSVSKAAGTAKASAYAQDSSGASSTHVQPAAAAGRSGLGRTSIPSAPVSSDSAAPAPPARGRRLSAAMYADGALQEDSHADYRLPAAHPAVLSASNPRTNAQIAAASVSASAYAYAATGAESSEDERVWGQPSAAEAAAAYVGNAMKSHSTASTVPRVDSAAVAAIEDTEREILQLRGQAKLAQEDKQQLEQRLGEVLSELDQRRLQVAELKSVVEALSRPGSSHTDASASNNGGAAVAGPSAPRRTASQNGATSAHVPAAVQGASKAPVPARVVAVLNETADAASRQGGLHRSVSEVHVDWDDVKESPMCSGARMA